MITPTAVVATLLERIDREPDDVRPVPHRGAEKRELEPAQPRIREDPAEGAERSPTARAPIPVTLGFPSWVARRPHSREDVTHPPRLEVRARPGESTGVKGESTCPSDFSDNDSRTPARTRSRTSRASQGHSAGEGHRHQRRQGRRERGAGLRGSQVQLAGEGHEAPLRPASRIGSTEAPRAPRRRSGDFCLIRRAGRARPRAPRAGVAPPRRPPRAEAAPRAGRPPPRAPRRARPRRALGGPSATGRARSRPGSRTGSADRSRREPSRVSASAVEHLEHAERRLAVHERHGHDARRHVARRLRCLAGVARDPGRDRRSRAAGR